MSTYAKSWMKVPLQYLWFLILKSVYNFDTILNQFIFQLNLVHNTFRKEEGGTKRNQSNKFMWARILKNVVGKTNKVILPWFHIRYMGRRRMIMERKEERKKERKNWKEQWNVVWRLQVRHQNDIFARILESSTYILIQFAWAITTLTSYKEHYLWNLESDVKVINIFIVFTI